MQKITPLNELEIEQVAGGPAALFVAGVARTISSSKLFKAGFEAGQALYNATR